MTPEQYDVAAHTIEKMASRYWAAAGRIGQTTREDMVQDGWVGASRAAKYHDPKKAPWGWFVLVAVSRAIRDGMTRAKTGYTRHCSWRRFGSAIPVLISLTPLDPDNESFESFMTGSAEPHTAELRTLLHELRQLPAYQAKYLAAWMAGNDDRQSGRMFGVTPSAICFGRNKGLKKLRTRLKDCRYPEGTL